MYNYKKNIYDISESDFRVIQKLVFKKYGKEYTLDYIRKVCKGKRKSIKIKNIAEKYLQVLKEMDRHINNLLESKI